MFFRRVERCRCRRDTVDVYSFHESSVLDDGYSSGRFEDLALSFGNVAQPGIVVYGLLLDGFQRV